MPEAGPARPAPTPLVRLARRRVPVGYLTGALVFWLAEPTRATLVAGSLIAVAGEALRIWAAGHLNKSREVTMSGPYRWCAHPLYVGSTVIGVGLAVACASLVVAAMIAAYVTVMLAAAVRSEEAFLRQRFGEHYDRYRSASHETAADRDVRRRFSLERAIANREHRALVGVAVALLLLAMKLR